MLNIFQKAAAWDKPESLLSLEEKIYIDDPSTYEEVEPSGFDIEKLGAIQHQSGWEDVELKARNIRASGGILYYKKEPRDPLNQPAGVVKVEGLIKVDSEYSSWGVTTQYLCQIYFPHPASRAAIGWACQCLWHEYVWSRKRFKGRFCSHALALYKETATKEVDYVGVPKQLYENIRYDLMEDNRLSPRQVDNEMQKDRRRFLLGEDAYNIEDDARKEFLDQIDFDEIEKVGPKRKKRGPASEIGDPEDLEKFRNLINPMVNHVTQDNTEEEEYFGPDYEKLTFPVWDESLWPEEGPMGPGTPKLSQYETKRSRSLRGKIVDLTNELKQLPQQRENLLQEQAALRERRKDWEALYEELSSLPLTGQNDPRVQEAYDKYNLQNSGEGWRSQRSIEIEKIKEQLKVVKNKINLLGSDEIYPNVEEGEKGLKGSRRNQIFKEMDSLKKDLRMELLNSRNVYNSSKYNEEGIKNMIYNLYLLDPKKAWEFSKLFDSSGSKDVIVKKLLKAYSDAQRRRNKVKRQNLSPGDKGYYEPQPGVFDEAITQEQVQQGIDRLKIAPEDEIKKPKKMIIEEEWVDEEGKYGEPGRIYIRKREEYIEDENSKESSITVLSSDLKINDITIYLQREMAKKNFPTGYTRKDFLGEQRGGLIPHPEASPIRYNDNGTHVFSPNDLGYHPELGDMGHSLEDRGCYGHVPVGSEVAIVSVDPKDRMVLVQYSLNSPSPNHQHIEIWIPIKEIDLI